LADFHQRVNKRLGRSGSPLELPAEESDSLLLVSLQGSLPPEPSNPLQAALREVDRRLVVEWLAGYRGQLEKYAEQWKDFEVPPVPEFFEVSFGRSGGVLPSTDQPLEFSADGNPLRISGRIDRIDTGVVNGHAVLNVVDYKTGGSIKLTPESVKAGTTLQLPLYVLAALELLLADRDMLPWRAGYWYVREDGFKPRQALKLYNLVDGRIELDPIWEEMRDSLGDILSCLVQGIRGARFPVCSANEHCTGSCPYNTVCRINQVRAMEKTCQPTGDN
jgi:ATP-dependent helicase/nuclease subunit B